MMKAKFYVEGKCHAYKSRTYSTGIKEMYDNVFLAVLRMIHLGETCFIVEVRIHSDDGEWYKNYYTLYINKEGAWNVEIDTSLGRARITSKKRRLGTSYLQYIHETIDERLSFSKIYKKTKPRIIHEFI